MLGEEEMGSRGFLNEWGISICVISAECQLLYFDENAKLKHIKSLKDHIYFLNFASNSDVSKLFPNHTVSSLTFRFYPPEDLLPNFSSLPWILHSVIQIMAVPGNQFFTVTFLLRKVTETLNDYKIWSRNGMCLKSNEVLTYYKGNWCQKKNYQLTMVFIVFLFVLYRSKTIEL